MEIVQSCRKIRKLNLSRLRDTLSDEVLQSVVSHCRLLEHLDIGGCHWVSDAVIRAVVESCPLLMMGLMIRLIYFILINRVEKTGCDDEVSTNEHKCNRYS